MTVSTSTSTASYAANGSTTTFAYPFKIFADGDLVVILRNTATAVETVQVLNSNYTVTGAGNNAGGNVVFGVAPAAGNTVFIRRELPLTQEVDYVPNDPFPADTHEAALDKLTMLVQQTSVDADRAIVFPQSDSGLGLTNVLPPAAARSNKVLGFKTDGGITTSTNTLTQFDAAVSSFVNATGNNAASILYDPAGSNALQTTVQAKLREFVSVKDFGAVGDGVTDDTVALQAFFDFITANNVAADWTGNFAISDEIIFGGTAFPSGVPQTKYVSGFMVLRAIAGTSIDKMFRVRQHYFARLGSIECIGTGGLDFSTRTCNVGVWLENTGRTSFTQIRGVSLRVAAAASVTGVGINNNLVYLGQVTARHVGSGMGNHSGLTGYETASLTANWSNKVDSGSSGGSQTTTIDVTTPLPDYIIDGRYGGVGTTPIGVFIDNRMYHITAATSTTITVRPWIDLTLTSGVLEYSFGAAVHLIGGDSSVLGVESIDAFICGTGVNVSSLYPPSIQRITTQFCGTGVRIGASPSSASVGGSIQDAYFEANRADIISASSLKGPNQYFYIFGIYDIGLNRIYDLFASRLNDNSFNANQIGLTNLIWNYRGRRYSGEGNALGNVQNFTRFPGDKPRAAYSNSLTVSLAGDDSIDVNRITGADTTLLTVLGTGTNNTPTGTVTFTCPSGWLINGGSVDANFVASGFRRPPVFTILWRHSAKEIIIRQSIDDLIDVTLTIASGESQVMPEVLSNKMRVEFVADNRPTYSGSFGAFGTELPVSFGGGSKIEYATTSGGSTADDRIRVFPNSANQITFQNNTTVTQRLRVLATPYRA